MIDLTILGTGGVTPTPTRHLSSCIFRYDGVSFLIDVGEGTQVAIKEAGYSLNKIDYIFLTHYHTDHIGGLPGILASMANSEKNTRLTIVGPQGLNRVLSAAEKLAPKLPFEVKTIEISEVKPPMLRLGGLQITPFHLEHKTKCFGYQVVLPRKGKCDPEMAKRNNVPMEFWSDLQNNQCINYQGRVLTKDLIMSPQRRGIKFVYVTDTCVCRSIENAIKDADLFICEGMFGPDMMISASAKDVHMTMEEACAIAAGSSVKELILTHFSPSMLNPYKYKGELKYICSKVTIGEDGLTRELRFKEE